MSDYYVAVEAARSLSVSELRDLVNYLEVLVCDREDEEAAEREAAAQKPNVEEV